MLGRAFSFIGLSRVPSIETGNNTTGSIALTSDRDDRQTKVTQCSHQYIGFLPYL